MAEIDPVAEDVKGGQHPHSVLASLAAGQDVVNQYEMRHRFSLTKMGPTPNGECESDGSHHEEENQASRSSQNSEVKAQSKGTWKKLKGVVKFMSTFKLHAELAMPEKCGWLTLLHAPPHKEERVWVVLRQRTVRWYADPTDTNQLGMVDFEIQQVEVERQWKDDSKRVENSLRNKPARNGACDFVTPFMEALLSSSEEPAVFRMTPSGLPGAALEWRAKSLSEGEEWVAVLSDRAAEVAMDANQTWMTNASSMGENVMAHRPLVDSGQSWWTVTSISPLVFSQIVRTGDVLLFRSPGALPQIIRTASGGRFDHVALLLRLEGGRIGLLEATGDQGVGLCSWDDFISHEWYSIYSEMALRRVSFERREDVLTDLQSWSGKVMGKPYSLNLGKLMQRKSLSEGGLPTDEAYFCSQLVAEALKVMKVLPRGKSSTQYWPSSFEAETLPQPDCIGGCSFDEQLKIDFGAQAKKKEGAHPARDVTARLW